jgi:mRNA-degrading endonuclease RelE of RelBE toxin-antitoxin system
MQIFCSTEFSKAVKNLTKSKYSNTYGTLKKEISDFFKQHDTFEKVFNKSYMLRENQSVRINKIRLDNPCQNSGGSGGYRLITLCDKRTSNVALLYVYPKTGAHGMNDTSTDFLIKIAKRYAEDKNANKLTEYTP